ncbi:unnamed protein product [Amoebophrya sp. A25]|nr:unnamed protein product [Amoebophrya sp. A25]|eukprot:GSA25T00017932001.1
MSIPSSSSTIRDDDSSTSTSEVVLDSKQAANTTRSTNCTTSSNQMATSVMTTSFLAGGFAGSCVDVALFPVDTLKTRAQAKGGFWASGGFKGIYQGLSAAALGSWPSAALFFLTYESLKPVFAKKIDYWENPPGHRKHSSSSTDAWRDDLDAKWKRVYSGGADEFDRRVKWMREQQAKRKGLGPDGEEGRGGSGIEAATNVDDSSPVRGTSRYEWLSHSCAASVGETIACLVRVPCENVKQKMQVAGKRVKMKTVQSSSSCSTAPSFFRTTLSIYNAHGRSLWGFYAGFGSTIAREIPFAFIQFPLYEGLKVKAAERKGNGQACSALEGAACGAVGGAVAAFLTTPMDVAKTRLMTATDPDIQRRYNMRTMLRKIATEEGVSMWFAGVTPRVTWISLGGFLFFGAYETAKGVLGMTGEG